MASVTLLLSEQDVASLLTMEECSGALEGAFQRQDAGLAMNQPRRRLRAPDGILHVMEAADLGLGRMAIKAYTSFRPKARFLVLLYDAANGDLLALMEAGRLSQMRTRRKSLNYRLSCQAKFSCGRIFRERDPSLA